VSGVEVVRSTGPSDLADSKVQVATCPAGKRAISGGGNPVFGSNGISGTVELVAIHASFPLTLSTGDSWDVQAVETNPDTITTWSLTAYAVCVTAP
jgi:hypothetical protein